MAGAHVKVLRELLAVAQGVIFSQFVTLRCCNSGVGRRGGFVSAATQMRLTRVHLAWTGLMAVLLAGY